VAASAPAKIFDKRFLKKVTEQAVQDPVRRALGPAR
jgi:hypothetical protein